MQKLLSFILGAAVSVNMASAQSGIIQELHARSVVKNVPLRANLHLDHKLQSVHGHQGALTAEVHGGKAPYSYRWSTGSYLSYINGLGEGTYSVTVFDANGARFVASAQIDGFNCEAASCEFRTQTQGGWGAGPNGNNSGVYLHANFDNAFPNGLVVGCNFTLTLTSAQAVTDFLPSGSGAAALSADLVDPAGTYSNVLAGQIVALSLSVGFDNYDANFGTSSAHLADLEIASGDFAGMTVQQFLDAANAFLGGCASPYTASQFNVAATAINENFDNGTVNENYLLCPSQENLEVSISKDDVSCNGDDNGSILVTVNVGNAPFVYTWSPAISNTASASNLAPGVYMVNVTDANGCDTDVQEEITQPEVLFVLGSADNATCQNSDGVAHAAASGGTEPYGYLWSPGGATTADVSGLAAGQYHVVVTDANGCTANTDVLIQGSSIDLQISDPHNATCPDLNDGSATVIATGGSEPYGYVWSPSGGTAASATGLGAGMYTVTVTDAQGCSAFIQVEILNVSESCPSRFGMTEKSTGAISVYPSVITSDIKILSSLEESAQATITISSLDGKVAISDHMMIQPKKEVSINTAELTPGIYSMSIIMGSQNHVYKIVKK